MDIGEKIKTLRKAKKLTQEQLAEYLNISAQAVSKWETGASAPDIDTLPKLAVFFGTTVDDLLDFDRRRIDSEVEKLVEESVPLRTDPAKAEAFYREALKKYPNNEVLLNCLIMAIPDERSKEKIAIGENLLDCTSDDAIKLDVLRLLAETCHAVGEQAMAERYLERLPELYFLKTEVAAGILNGAARMEEIEKTEDVCVRVMLEMLAMRQRLAPEEKRAEYDRLAEELLALFRDAADYRERAGLYAQWWQKKETL